MEQENRIKVVKFGGTSLASADQFRKVAEIIHADETRRYVVASAPGKRYLDDTKVTDLLYKCYDNAINDMDAVKTFEKIEERFDTIIHELGLTLSLSDDYETIRTHLRTTPERDYMASRGEYLNSKILAAFLGFTFIDPASAIVFRPDGHLDDEKTDAKLKAALANTPYAVVPGFYGAFADGRVKTFSRGGSDVTGSLVARAVKADVYENWTDVSGLRMADPRIISNPNRIEVISYRELRELTYSGASVLHEDAVFPVREAGIPINIRNTNEPDATGTMIVPEVPRGSHHTPITGIAGRKGFTTIFIEKNMMNAEIGFGRKVLSVLEECGVSFEHMPSGIDTLSIIVNTVELKEHRTELIRKINNAVKPDAIIIENNLALIAVVGHGMMQRKGVSAKIFTALANADVNIRMINQGSSELNIIIGIDDSNYETAIRAIYTAFYGEKKERSDG